LPYVYVESITIVLYLFGIVQHYCI